MAEETRFRITRHADPAHYDELVGQADERIQRRLRLYEALARAK
jgi:hypothetical protein